ncbi:MAG: hypothetical protein AUJ55_10115 [Proteobacteria bacterium CG1_02_64_396]|nr:MAG: hypothetical protein AUJ55_10115 [Proteobacteria bacterium CG1_02_64_396]
MSSQHEDPTPQQGRLIAAYDKMVERVRDALDKAPEITFELLDKGIGEARQAAIKLGELTENEAKEISEAVKRDMANLNAELRKQGKKLEETFDPDHLKTGAISVGSFLLGKIREGLDFLEDKLDQRLTYHTRDVTGIGTLTCTQCGQQMHFKKTGVVPPCPKCHGQEFKRGF